MIDDKKIEEACDRAFKKIAFDDEYAYPFVKGFDACAEWIQEEFLRNLWHPIAKVPRKHYTDILVVRKKPHHPKVLDPLVIFYKAHDDAVSYKDEWLFICDELKIIKYCYIGDLIPNEQEGGKQ